MREQFEYTQRFADAIKAVANVPKALPAQRRAALDAVSRFEGCDWQPEVMQRCIEFLNIKGLELDGEGRLVYNDPDVSRVQGALMVEVLLNRYADILETGIELPTYSTREAAVYLGVSVEAVKTYVHRDKSKTRLKGIKRGHDLMFTREALDQLERPKVGRPRLVSE